jgi:hypothetical protein
MVAIFALLTGAYFDLPLGYYIIGGVMLILDNAPASRV